MPARRRGFTLIELLIVVVIIGILATIAIPKFQATKGKALTASMRSDLRNLVVSQDGYFFSNSVYSTSLAALEVTPSKGVAITVHAADAGGWSATATHAGGAPEECGIFIGTATPVGPAISEGLIKCGPVAAAPGT
ncbi:MAG TPA: prepilin-type N-terminal cleavage/methylation domain-containing protein [Gemmatimonadales bacterium]|nr:prepilin-type N-terminal cleavage/methylation domain-containing protein [Gemmatimonadales bacterium]